MASDPIHFSGDPLIPLPAQTRPASSQNLRNPQLPLCLLHRKIPANCPQKQNNQRNPTPHNLFHPKALYPTHHPRNQNLHEQSHFILSLCHHLPLHESSLQHVTSLEDKLSTLAPKPLEAMATDKVGVATARRDTDLNLQPFPIPFPTSLPAGGK